MGPIWVLSAPGGPHVGPMNLAVRVVSIVSADVVSHNDDRSLAGTAPNEEKHLLTVYVSQ